MRKRPRHPRQTVRRLVSAAELARRQGVDPRTVRRWSLAGCPVARRGKRGHAAPRFDEAAVTAWLGKYQLEEREMLRSLIAVNDARARRTRNDLLRLQKQYVRQSDIAAVWAALVAHVRRATLAMVSTLAPRIAALAGAPARKPTPPPDRRFLPPDEVRALLDAQASPLRPAARPAIKGLIERGLGLELLDDGSWFAWNPADGIPAPPMPPPIESEITSAVHLLLTTLSTSEIKTPAPVTAPLRSVNPSPTLRAARAQLAYHQALLVALRDQIASGVVTLREDLEREGKTRALAFRSRLLVLARRLPPDLAPASAAGIDEIRAVLTRAVTQACGELRPLHDLDAVYARQNAPGPAAHAHNAAIYRALNAPARSTRD